MIEMSVGLPLFKSDKIIWLAMEGLCRQRGVDFEWELIACEELYYENAREYCGEKYFESYRDRLWAAGCRQISYIGPSDYTYLEKKWNLISGAMAGSSKALLLQGSDDFSAPERLAWTRAAIGNGFDWYCTDAVFYHIFRRRMAYFNPKDRRGVFIGIRKELLDGLSFRERGCGVDTYLYKHCKSVKSDLVGKYDTLLSPKGVCTDGLNRICKDRPDHYSNRGLGFGLYTTRLEGILPGEIITRLKALGGNQ